MKPYLRFGSTCGSHEPVWVLWSEDERGYSQATSATELRDLAPGVDKDGSVSSRIRAASQSLPQLSVAGSETAGWRAFWRQDAFRPDTLRALTAASLSDLTRLLEAEL